MRERFTWKGVAMIVHAWALISGAIALVAWCSHSWLVILAYPLAVGMNGKVFHVNLEMNF